MKKRVISLLLSATLLLSVFSVANAAEGDTADTSAPPTAGEPVPVADGFQEMASNDNFVLYFDSQNCYVAVQDKRTNAMWYSNPLIEDDPLASGIANTNLKSQLGITYTNRNKTQISEMNSYAGSVAKETFSSQKITDGVRVDFNFSQLGITIPVTYVLEEDGLAASVLVNEITEGDNQLITVTLLEYFGAGSMEDEGYLFVPDGSGAIINFNNGKTKVDAYSKEVYGEDVSRRNSNSPITSRTQKISLPVYGLVSNGCGFLAEITEGAAVSAIEASVSAKTSSYNTIFSTMTYRISDRLSMRDQTDSTSDIIYNGLNPTALENYTVKYHFLDSTAVTYSDLASTYRTILQEEGMTKTNSLDNRLFVELYGGVTKTKSFIGFLYQGTEKLTTFEQAQSILTDLKGQGVNNITVLYENYSDDFFNRNIQVNLAPSGSLGGKNGMQNLLNYASEAGVGIYPAANFTTLPTGGNGFSTFSDVANAVNVSPVLVYDYLLNTNMRDTSSKPTYLLAPSKYTEAADKILAAMSKYSYENLYFNQEALQLYGDYSKEGYQRERAEEAYVEAMTRLSDGYSLTMANPNAYLYAYADYITDLPLSSSDNVLFDYDIPFVQMVLKGTKGYSGNSININDMSQETFLRHIEYGADLKYTLIEAETTVLMNTDYTDLYSVTYDTFRDQIVEQYGELEQVGKEIGDASITSHERDGEVAVVRYSNGKTVYVNYGDEEVTVDGVSIPAIGYVVH